MKEMRKKIKYPWGYYLTLNAVCRIGRWLFRGKSEESASFKEAKKNGPILLMCNHASSYDFLFFIPPFGLKKMNFVVAENMLYSTPFLGNIFRKAGVITKKQYVLDLGCIRRIKRSLEEGVSVAMCPAGQVASSGKGGVMPSANGKLIKFLGYPVGIANTSGAGLSKPKWAKNIRIGKVVTKCDILYTQKEVEELSVEELQEGLSKALDFNEHVYQQNNGIRFKGKNLAEGLEKILYQCPKCGEKYTIKSEGNTLFCVKCGNTIEYKDSGELLPIGSSSTAPMRIDLWYEWERENIKESVKNGEYRLEKEVALFVENPKESNYRYVSKGRLKIEGDRLIYQAESNLRPKQKIVERGLGSFNVNLDLGEETEDVEEEFMALQIKIKGMESCAFNPGVSFECYSAKHVYRFVFLKDKASTEFVFLIEEIGKINLEQKKNKNTNSENNVKFGIPNTK